MQSRMLGLRLVNIKAAFVRARSPVETSFTRRVWKLRWEAEAEVNLVPAVLLLCHLILGR